MLNRERPRMNQHPQRRPSRSIETSVVRGLVRLGALCTALSVVATIGGAQSNGNGNVAAPPRLEIYGFGQADMIFEANQNDPNWFDVMRPTKLPAFEEQFGRDGRTYLGARQSRFGAKGTLPTTRGDVFARFEFDLFGVGVDAGQTTIRLRHAYGQWGQWGAGQLESPFMDVDVFPNILDYWGPAGMLFFRNVQIFWQPLKSDHHRMTFAAERPGASADAGIYAERIELDNVRARFPSPDFSGEYRYSNGWGYAELAGIARPIRWDQVPVDTLNLSGGTTGWGVSLSTNLNLSKSDVFRGQVIYGEGIQNYFNDAPVDVGIENNLSDLRQPVVGVALPILGVSTYLDHAWSSTWSSSIGYSLVDIENSDAQAASAFRTGQYASVNALWTPIKNVMIGGELQWLRRENFSDGFSVDDVRFQVAFKYSFSQQLGGQP
jgi:hypothetical protein